MDGSFQLIGLNHASKGKETGHGPDTRFHDGLSVARKQLRTVLRPRLGPSLDRILVDATCLTSRGLPWILILLNNMPCTKLGNTRAVSLVSYDVVLWAPLKEVNCECSPLIMGEGA